MSYSVEYEPEAVDDLSQLTQSIQKRIINKLVLNYIIC